MPTLLRHTALRTEIANLTSHVAGSVFSEAYAGTLEESVRDSATVRSALSRNTKTRFSSSKLSNQFKSIAKIIADIIIRHSDLMCVSILVARTP